MGMEMAIFVLSDPHLSTHKGTNKAMDVFGSRWQDYTAKLEKSWRAVVGENDTVVLPGDISWAMKLEEAESDLRFLDNLPGKKLLGKGNHDFWWMTASKMNGFFKEKGFSTLSILYNNAYIVEDRIICGTRGWFPDESRQVTVGEVDHGKIVNREVMRLKLSLDAAKALQKQREEGNREILPIWVFLHFPPVWGDFVMEELVAVLKDYGVENCVFGHIHSVYSCPGKFSYEGIKFTLASSDFLNFLPLKL